MTVSDTFSPESANTPVDTPTALTPRSTPPKLVVDGNAVVFFQYAQKPILAGILGCLDRTDRVFLALTCHGAHSRIAPLLGVDASRLNRTLSFAGWVSFLTTLARDLPDHYVCEQCMRPHEVGIHQGHAADVALVENASYQKRAGETALEPPCQRSKPALTTSSPHIRPVHGFKGNLSSAQRTPLAGVLHRDVELTLKRARLLKAMDDDEAEHAWRALVATDLSDHDLNGDDCDDTDVQSTTSMDNPVGSITITHIVVPTGPAGPAHPASVDGSDLYIHRPHRKNGCVLSAREAVSHRASALVPGQWKSQNYGHSRGRSHSHSQTKTRRQQLEATLAAALGPSSADRLIIKTGDAGHSIYSYEQKTTVKYTFAPKLVGDRFLLKTTVKIQRNEVENIALSVCPHQLLNHRVPGGGTTGPRRHGARVSSAGLSTK